MSSVTPPRHFVFDPTPEIFATDNSGRFLFELKVDGNLAIETHEHDELRFVTSIWHPAAGRTLDLDRVYVELLFAWQPGDHRWIKLAEIEPVVPPYSQGETFDGWIVLPVVGATTAYALAGSGFDPRARLQIRAGIYLVA